MRVALVAEQVDARRGGAETSTLEMARNLARLGLDVTVVAAGEPDESQRVLAAAGGYALRCVPVRGVTRAMRTRDYLQSAARLVRAEPFDIVHAIVPCAAADVYQPRGGTYGETIRRSNVLVRNRLTRMIRSYVRRMNWRQQYLLTSERRLLGGAAPPHVAAVSSYVADQVRRDFPHFPPDRLHVVFNGVDIAPLAPEAQRAARDAWRQRLGISPATPVVLFVAHNFRLKGLETLVQACAASEMQRADAPRWMLVIAGRDHPGRYEQLAIKLRIDRRIRMIGDSTPMRELYALADVLAHPTWYDPCSRVVLEALVCGLPVVTTTCNGAADALERGVTGEVIEPGDAAGLCAAIERVLVADQRANVLARLPQLQNRLAMQRHTRELLALYEHICGRSRAERRNAT